MTLESILTIIAIISGPIVAVLLTIYIQKIQAAKDRRYLLFFVLMAGRKASPPSDIWKSAVNVLEAVFSDNEELYHLYRHWIDELMDINNDPAKRERKFVQMMDAFARDLGYENIQQIDISRVPF